MSAVLLRGSDWRCTSCDTPWMVVWWVDEEVKAAQLEQSRQLRLVPRTDPRITFSHADGVLSTAAVIAQSHADKCGVPLVGALRAQEGEE
jgi:hypothetical protein